MMEQQKLTLADLATGLSRRASLPMRYSEDFVRSFFKVIADGLMHDNLVKVKGFGTFKLIGIEARESINVATGERIEIAGHTKVSFTPDPALRDAVNKPFVEFDTVILNEGTDTALMEATDDEVLSESIAKTQVETPEAATVQIAQFVEESVQEETIEELAQDEVVEEPLQEEAAVEEPVQQEIIEEPVHEDNAEVEVEDEEDEVVDVQDDDNESDEKENKQQLLLEGDMNDNYDTIPGNNGHSTFLMILVALLFTVIGYCLGYYWHPVELPKLFIEKTEDAESKSKNPQKAKADDEVTVEVVIEDSTAVGKTADAAASADYPQLEGGEYLIVGVLANDTMKAGKMLSKMASQYYGDKDLYTYICTMNHIENPDIVPLNMPLLIPKLEKKQE